MRAIHLSTALERLAEIGELVLFALRDTTTARLVGRTGQEHNCISRHIRPAAFREAYGIGAAGAIPQLKTLNGSRPPSSPAVCSGAERFVAEQAGADQGIARAGRAMSVRAQPDGLRSKYLVFSIIQTGSKPRRSMPLLAVGAVIAAGAALILVFGQ